jgi:phosphate transport system substrate-binding protein
MASRIAVAAICMAAIVGLLSGCPKASTETPSSSARSSAPKATPQATPSANSIQAKGSDTLLQVAQALAEAYKTVKPDVQITVTGGGTGTGFTALADGTCDIADASRKIEDKETAACKAKSIEPVENMIGYDGIAVIVNKANPIEKITIDQLSDLFVGQIADWKALGGKGEVVLLSRDSASGTYQYFKENVVQKGDKKSPRDFAASAQRLPSNAQIRDQVAATAGGVGYIGLGYVNDSVKVVAVVGKSVNAVKPSVATVLDGTYPISRPLFMYTKKDASENITSYIKWIVGPDGQRILAKEGYVPLKK